MNELNLETPSAEIMREPFAEGISDYLERIRRNLLIFGFIALAYKLSGAKIASDSTIFGIHFIEIELKMLEFGLLALLAYHLVHFSWAAWEEADKWRVRFTGFSSMHPRETTFDNQLARNEVFHTTLYNWWLFEAEYVKRKLDWFTKCQNRLNDLETAVNECIKHSNEKNANDIASKLRDLKSTLTELNIPYDPLLVHWGEIKKPLERFDKCFWRQQKSWYLRWVFIEALLPLTIGSISAFWLVVDLWIR